MTDALIHCHLAPASNDDALDWLGERERAYLASLHFDKRRREWLSGRVEMKRLIRRVSPEAAVVQPAAIEILKSPTGAPYLSPEANWGGSLSLSHSHGMVLVGYCRQGASFGVDLERVEPREPSFADTFFNDNELASLKSCAPGLRDLAVTAIWSLKEAALKAMGTGLSLDTRRLTVRIEPAQITHLDWSQASVAQAGQKPLRGWVRLQGAFIVTVAAHCEEAAISYSAAGL